MRNRDRLNVLTLLVAAVFILSLFPGIAVAQTPAEQYEKAREQEQLYKQRYENAKQKFTDAEEKFKSARQKFRTAKDNQSRAELLDRAKEYLERAIDQMISHLEVLKSRAENAENKDLIPFNAVDIIENHISRLETIRIDVQQANTPQQLIESGRDLRDEWVKIRLETRYYTGILVNHRIDLFLVKADNASAKMDEVIQKLKEQGRDTSRLEDEASAFNRLVNEARTDYQKVSDLYATHKGFDENGMVTSIQDAQVFIRESSELEKDALRELRDAISEYRDFFKEAKKHIGGKVAVRGTGTLWAAGNGRAVIEGNATITLSGINGTLIVSGNADVETDGRGTKEVLGNGDVRYQGFGSATITGENIRVEISGNNIDLKATGTGSAVLSGSGTYRTEKAFGVSGEWNREG